MELSIKTLLKILEIRWSIEIPGNSNDKRSAEAKKFEVSYLSNPISYEDFFYNFIFLNTPCVLGKWATVGWKSRKEWHSSVPNFEFLGSKFGESKVPVADCMRRFFNSQCKSELRFQDFLIYWKNYIDQGYPTDSPCLYLKDWHFVKEFKDYEAYAVPKYFQSDWLNEYCDKASMDDFRFVYMGPKGSWTPFHADVYRSFSWSANVSGRKKWILFPPGTENQLESDRNELPYDVTVMDTAVENMNCIIVIQEPGEVLFVPSGWYHQVQNLEDTISINHNWLNGCNLTLVVKFFLCQLKLVEHEISDCKTSMSSEEWIHQCQTILKADSGMDLSELLSLIHTIAESRINKVKMEASDLNSNVHCESIKRTVSTVCTIIGKRLSHLQRNNVLPSLLDTELDTSLCEVHVWDALFDLCMILDAIDELLCESNQRLKKSDFAEANLILSKVYKCLQDFVNIFSEH